MPYTDGNHNGAAKLHQYSSGNVDEIVQRHTIHRAVPEQEFGPDGCDSADDEYQNKPPDLSPDLTKGPEQSKNGQSR